MGGPGYLLLKPNYFAVFWVAALVGERLTAYSYRLHTRWKSDEVIYRPNKIPKILISGILW